MKISEELRGVVWELEPVSCTGTAITLRAIDHDVSMAASLLEFSLWDARCVQIKDWHLSEESIEALEPFLKQHGARWRIGWKRKATKPRVRTSTVDQRQLDLFSGSSTTAPGKPPGRTVSRG